MFFRVLSAANPAQLRSSAMWQSSHDMPREAAKNPIVVMNWSTGIPFMTWTFLKTWSEIGGLSVGACALTIATPSREAINAAAANVVFLDPNVMLSPAARSPVITNKKGRECGPSL
jgi:hypothetical protein